MSTLPEVFLRSLIIGLAVAAPVGAMAVLCMQRTVLLGPRAGLATGIGIATADALYAAVAAFGLTAVSGLLVAWQPALRLGGGAFLLWLGVGALRRPPCAAEASEAPTGFGMYASSVLLTLTNPMTIMAFAAVFAGAGLVFDGGLASAGLATLGVGLGSAAWWAILVTLGALLRGRSSERLLLVLGKVSAVVLLAFGGIALASGALALLPK